MMGHEMKHGACELHLDVTGTVDVTDPVAVCAAVSAILQRRYPRANLAALPRLFADFERLYRGSYPGFFACDTQYHDMQHVLDVTLAAARLIDGYDGGRGGGGRLGPQLAVVGISVALFHDSGYIRRKGDSRHVHGAEYTRIHVSRSARFLAEYLPTIGLLAEAPIASRLVHFTGYEFDPAEMPVDDARQRDLGALIGSADVLAQMADVAYLEKCRDRLFREFELGGIARQVDDNGRERVRYASPVDLLKQTPDFIRHTVEERLEGLFGGIYRCVEAHFDGRNLYMEALQRNLRHLEQLLAHDDETLLASDPLRPLARSC
jgi:hypothetical protein